MKILPKHHSLRTLFYLILMIGGILIFFFPAAVAFTFRAHLLFLVVTLLLIITPWANRRSLLDHPNSNKSDQATRKLPFVQALGLTLLIQIALILAFYTICHLTAVTLPISIATFPLFQASWSILMLDWGIFPWGIYILLAVALSYTSYLNEQPGNMSTLLRPLLKNKADDVLSLTADVSTKIMIAFTLAFTLALLGLECMGLVGAFFDVPLAYGLRLDVFLAMLVMLQWVKGTTFLDKQLSQLLRYLGPGWITAGFLGLLVIALFAASALINWLSPIITPPLHKSLDFAPEDWPIIWAIFSGMWWLGWAPLVAGMVACVWRGYKIRTMMIWTLLAPVTVGMLAIAYPNWKLDISLNTSPFNLIPAVLAAVIIIGLFLSRYSITYAWKGTLPLIPQAYRRSPRTFLQRLLQLIVAFMGLYWAGGIYIPSLFYFVILLPAGVFIFAMGVGVFGTFKRLNG